MSTFVSDVNQRERLAQLITNLEYQDPGCGDPGCCPQPEPYEVTADDIELLKQLRDTDFLIVELGRLSAALMAANMELDMLRRIDVERKARVDRLNEIVAKQRKAFNVDEVVGAITRNINEIFRGAFDD